RPWRYPPSQLRHEAADLSPRDVAAAPLLDRQQSGDEVLPGYIRLPLAAALPPAADEVGPMHVSGVAPAIRFATPTELEMDTALHDVPALGERSAAFFLRTGDRGGFIGLDSGSSAWSPLAMFGNFPRGRFRPFARGI